MPTPIRTILLDIEGTVGSISFVKNVLFPLAKQQYAEYVHKHMDDASVRVFGNSLDEIVDKLNTLHDSGSKDQAFKALQGSIWKDAYENGKVVAHLFPDVVPLLKRAADKGVRVCIYSSGSVPAQKLYFHYSEYGDLSNYISEYYDTSIGPKVEADSYKRIVGSDDPATWLFLSDNVHELDAARQSGLKVGLAVRPGNEPVSSSGYSEYGSFDSLL
ncbi:methionine salvage haloacid dehalogenase-like hydrolase [Schizosaccharomyces japonicus yFS275]|uniref:Enolase-phosphatase E1 n=1 Tax=Schizosaccharomyces japonicus (strain yFS275 / FY16936) TaxID=402676 RepID=ENOPH_SCHJY|nr:methionine salvage haloacid dehalogenase-like hydrolase [Schizosaccharomyces japonicus yFS275]B6JXU1.1 RecName: Full=Enolase-phosphatase E1; AltName: Full=2,3-diketo-5-methylthio-1-phosphopentane phosphatase [Schizosaccharomyces japonicus yFS275]EEB06359.1 methionine salvage haloacid dehalogenase-like hydrolase [Schizosaccharomyces japonicus yFS275]